MKKIFFSLIAVAVCQVAQAQPVFGPSSSTTQNKSPFVIGPSSPAPVFGPTNSAPQRSTVMPPPNSAPQLSTVMPPPNAAEVVGPTPIFGPSSSSSRFVIGPSSSNQNSSGDAYNTKPLQVGSGSNVEVVGPTPVFGPTVPTNNPVEVVGPVPVFGPASPVNNKSPFVIGPSSSSTTNVAQPNQPIFGPSSPSSKFVIGPAAAPNGNQNTAVNANTLESAAKPMAAALNSSNSVFCSGSSNANCGWALKAQ